MVRFFTFSSSSLFIATLAKAIARPNPLSTDEKSLTLSKRGPSPRQVGVGFAITFSILLFGIIVFYLGVRRGQTGTWYCWRDVPTQSANDNGNDPESCITEVGPEKTTLHYENLKTRISCPVQVRSSALVELSPVEAPRPKALELPSTNVIYELGQPSPRRPSFFDRKSWFRNHIRDQQAPPPIPMLAAARDERQSRSRRKSEKSMYEMDGESAVPPVYPGPALLRDEALARRSSGGALGIMDWSGMEYVRKMYGERSERKSVSSGEES